MMSRSIRSMRICPLAIGAAFSVSACAVSSIREHTDASSDVVISRIEDSTPQTSTILISATGADLRPLEFCVSIFVDAESRPPEAPLEMTLLCPALGGDMHELSAGTLPGHPALNVPMREILDVPFETECELTLQQPDPAVAIEIEWHAEASIFWKESSKEVGLDLEIAEPP